MNKIIIPSLDRSRLLASIKNGSGYVLKMGDTSFSWPIIVKEQTLPFKGQRVKVSIPDDYMNILTEYLAEKALVFKNRVNLVIQALIDHLVRTDPDFLAIYSTVMTKNLESTGLVGSQKGRQDVIDPVSLQEVVTTYLVSNRKRLDKLNDVTMTAILIRENGRGSIKGQPLSFIKARVAVADTDAERGQDVASGIFQMHRGRAQITHTRLGLGAKGIDLNSYHVLIGLLPWYVQVLIYQINLDVIVVAGYPRLDHDVTASTLFIRTFNRHYLSGQPALLRRSISAIPIDMYLKYLIELASEGRRGNYTVSDVVRIASSPISLETQSPLVLVDDENWTSYNATDILNVVTRSRSQESTNLSKDVLELTSFNNNITQLIDQFVPDRKTDGVSTSLKRKKTYSSGIGTSRSASSVFFKITGMSYPVK